MARIIRCTVIEVSPLNDLPRAQPRNRCFEDVIPWGDPYILALIEKLRELDAGNDDDPDATAELPPPLTGEPHEPSEPDWSRRTWPGTNG
jgi:hypothetical protein